MPLNSRSYILLAAGSGSRMRPLTDNMPKSMLDVGGISLLQRILNELTALSSGEIVVVTGFQSNNITNMVAQCFGDRVKLVHNPCFEYDVNILSVDIGVDALRHPEYGYTIVETDLLIDSLGWEAIHNYQMNNKSFWVTNGFYQEMRTGGIVHVNEHGVIDDIKYVPEYDSYYDKWLKMLGVLSVCPKNVDNDRLFRKAAIRHSMQQYYLAPWITNISDLPVVHLDLSHCFSASFNTPQEFKNATKDFFNTVISR